MKRFECTNCDIEKSYYASKCPRCSSWNTMREIASESEEDEPTESHEDNEPTALTDVEEEAVELLPSGIDELDRVLSSAGGAALGGLYLVAGPPGIGKSTILMQALIEYAQGGPCLYVSGEESKAQTARSARRLLGRKKAPGDLILFSSTDLDAITRTIERMEPIALVLDSIQTIGDPKLDSEVGGVLQVREVTRKILEITKRLGIASFLIGHVTKEGIAGPKTLEHLVDAVLEFSGERTHVLRSLRAQKNRFGATTPIGIFRMTSSGLEGVPNPSEAFLAERALDVPGSMVAATYESHRAMLVEVQANVADARVATPRRTTHGVDSQRLAMLLAVLGKIEPDLSSRDVFVNVAGGISVRETGIDLPLALALHSSFLGKPIHASVAAFGEIGLAGEIRSVEFPEARLEEIASMGFSTVLVPAKAGKMQVKRASRRKVVQIVPVATLEEALATVQETARRPRLPRASRRLKR